METPLSGTILPVSPQKNWFGRNWKWFVPVASLAVIVLFAAFIAAVFGLVEASFQSSSVYTQALARARANPQVSGQIGLPLKAGWFTTGNLNIDNDDGNADLVIPISGPKGKGKIYVVAKKTADVWRYETLEVEVNGQPDRILLLQASDEPTPSRRN
jgi:hypothetical protein